jgi:hypothetical protein
MWCIWIMWNHAVFQQQLWPLAHMQNFIWIGVLEYAQAAWTRVNRQIIFDPASAKRALGKFDKDWARHDLLCIRYNSSVTWIRRNPLTGIG